MTAFSSFEDQVGQALAHIYDPQLLSSHPLLGVLGLSAGSHNWTDLQQVLLDGIESLKPSPSVPVTSRLWRAYKLLHLRFVQQLDQKQAAYQLGICVRHLRREQKIAVKLLADALARKYLPGETVATSDEIARNKVLEEEILRLRASSQEVSAALEEAFSNAIRLVTPLANEKRVVIRSVSFPSLPRVIFDPVALRHVLVLLISVAISRVPEGHLHFATEISGNTVVLRVSGVARVRLSDDTEDNAIRLKAVRTILNTYHSTVMVEEMTDRFEVRLTLPIADQVRICLLDDNEDIGALFERYLSGTRYKISYRRSADGMFEWIAEVQPHVIVLDVMMPVQDGWELLGRLRQHPMTFSIPIIVCSVLPEGDLAMALGATAYLPKPVTRTALLTALGQLSLGEAPMPGQ